MPFISNALRDFALKLKYPFQYPNSDNHAAEIQLASVEDWVEAIRFGYGPDEDIEFKWEYIDHEQFKNV